MKLVLLVALAGLAGPARAEPPEPAPAPSSAWLERQQTAAADEANVAAAAASKTPQSKEACRVVKQWKAGDTVVTHRVCEDAPKPAAPARQG